MTANRDVTKSRGYRNKNPGNIDHQPQNKWQGLATPPLEAPPLNGGRSRFAVFVSHEYGIRALALLLITYQDRHGLKTIRQIINRWAPGTENNTTSYVRFVDDQMPGHGPDDVLDLHKHEDLKALVVAIIRHEIGGNPYADSVIEEGLRMAGVPKPTRTLTQAARTGTGRAAITAGGVTAMAGAAASAAPALEALQGIPPLVGVAVVAAVFAGVVLFILLRRRRPEE